jgi:hypothetical protein
VFGALPVNENDAARRDEHHVTQFLGQHPVAVPMIEVDVCGDLQPRAREVNRAVGEVIHPSPRWRCSRPHLALAVPTLPDGVAGWGRVVGLQVALAALLMLTVTLRRADGSGQRPNWDVAVQARVLCRARPSGIRKSFSEATAVSCRLES